MVKDTHLNIFLPNQVLHFAQVTTCDRGDRLANSFLMAESRRVPFTTLPCNAPKIDEKPTQPTQTPVCASTSTALLCNGNPSEQSPNPESTVRCVLTLFEPDERTFPEFNYAELLEKKVGRCSDYNATNYVACRFNYRILA